LQRLPGAAAELNASVLGWREAHARISLLTGIDATPERLATELASRPRVVHIAAHMVQREVDRRGTVLFRGDTARDEQVVVRRPAEMYLLLSMRPDGQPDGLTARSVAAFRLPGTLVVMSGCGSGLGTHQAGAGLAGFFKSWIAAGASGVVGTLWPIPDDASDLFLVFYDRLRRGFDAAAALREAQLALLAKGGTKAQPAFWGAWTMVGRN
jgi:CHAT domain-containing protein